MTLLWTKSKLPLGPLITWGLEQPVSHFAIEFNEKFVLQSNFMGVHFTTSRDFYKWSRIVYSKRINIGLDKEKELIFNVMSDYFGRKYDWKWFFWLVKAAFMFKVFRKPIPPSGVWQSRSKFLCTECVKLLEPYIGVVEIGDGSPMNLWHLLKDRVYDISKS